MKLEDLKYLHLLGKEWDHGRQDCYSVCREFFFDNFGIKLTNYARPDEWWDHGMDLYKENFHREGFEIVDVAPYQAQPCDLFMLSVYHPSMKARPRVWNHLGIFVNPLLQQPMLHHFIGRRSEMVSMSGVWRNNLCAVLRHKDVVIDEPSETINALDLLPPHIRVGLHVDQRES